MLVESFDFGPFLLDCTGHSCWEILDLKGGASNYTARAQRSRDLHCDCAGEQRQKFSSYSRALSKHDSFVLKQAPEFLAKAPEFAFSPYRQVVEASALQAFRVPLEDHRNELLNTLQRHPRIMIPQVLLHDKAAHILAQSDLGALPNLYDVLMSSDTSPLLAIELGKTIGVFLADMHNALPALADSVSKASVEKFLQPFQNDDADRVIEAVIGQATERMREAGIPDYQFLGKQAAEHWKAREKTVFGQGDLWFGTLLVDCSPQMPTSSNIHQPIVAVGICDWEFAGPNHPAADIAQLGSYLHLLSLSPFTSTSVREILLAFSESLYGSYFSSLTFLGDDFEKSLLIMHGWEMVNAAGWDSRQYMWCSCFGQGVRCSHIKEMVIEGARLLRAGAQQEDLCQALRDIAWCRFFPVLSSLS